MTTNLLSIGLGCFFLLLAVFQFFRLLILLRKGISVSATIIDLVKVPRIHGYTVYFPILEFITENGIKIRQRSYIGLDRSHQKKIGESILIVYNPDKPEHFLLNNGFDKYWKVLGSVIAGLAFILAGGLNLL